MKTKLILIISIFLFCIALAQDAQEKSYMEYDLQAYLVTEVTLDNGKIEERFTPAEEAEPGNIIEYRLTGRNISDVNLKDVILNGVIPEGTFYIDNSASDDDIAMLEFTAPGYTAPSGGKFGPAPLTVTIVINGEEKEVVIPSESYTALRWQLREPIAAESEVTFIYRVEVK